jgi:hypothetical protein
VPIIETAHTYLRTARQLSRHWHRPFAATLARLIASRLIYNRGPSEFDEMGFVDKPLREWRGYTCDEDMHALHALVTPPEHRYLEEDKAAFAAHCDQAGIPTPRVLAVTAPRSTERAFPQFPLVANGGDLAAVLAREGDIDGFAKARRGGVGYGSFAFSVRNGVVTTRDGSGDAHFLFERCASSRHSHSGFVLQTRVHAHRSLKQWMPEVGLGTIRIVSFIQRNGDIVIPMASLKMPAPGADCDNYRFGTIVSAVNTADGTLGPAMGTTGDIPVVRPHDTHPVTNARITGATIPFWSDVLSLVQRAARAFDVLPALGWDVAIGEDGPIIIEANVGFGSTERASRHGQLEEFRALFSRVTPVNRS